MPQIVTANRLGDGRVVFLTPAGDFSANIADSAVAEDESAARKLLAIGEAAEAACRVVDPYLVDVRKAEGGPEPLHIRETIRARGPTVAHGAR